MTGTFYPPTTYNPVAGTGQLLIDPPFDATTPPVLPITTTLIRIKACDPCDDGWQEGLRAAGKTQPDDPITYETILDAVGLDKALWCCRAEGQHANLWRRYAVWCARQVQRSIAALDVADRHTAGKATDSELDAARDAVWAAGAAVWAEDAAWAAWAAAWVARAAGAAGDAQAAAFRQLVTTGTLPAVEQKQEVAA